MHNYKVYLAAPWFNQEQKERHDAVLKLLDQHTTNVRSPFRIFVCPPDADAETREKTFMGNLQEIREADLVVAVTDGKDPGTLWEMGYAFARGIPVVGVALALGDRPFNLMLAEGCRAVARTLPELLKILDAYGENREAAFTKYEGTIE